MNTFDYLFAKARENGKVAEALSEKLQTEVDKNKIVDEIGKIDVGAVVQAAVKKSGIELQNLTFATAEYVSRDSFRDRIYVNSFNFPIANRLESNALQNCISLSQLYTPQALTIGDYAIQNCISLTQLDLPSATSIGYSAFGNCISLTQLNLPSVTIINNNALCNCISLTHLDLPSVTSIANYAFLKCNLLSKIKLGTSEIVTLANTNALQETPIAKGNGYIFVRDELVEDYKSATNWSVYADQIRPMSEYVEE